jgi:hypothetical protein
MKERGLCDFISGGEDGDMLGTSFQFFESTEISSFDVYIGATTTPGTAILGHVLAYDQSISDFTFLYTSELITLEEADLGTWKNIEFIDPAIIALSADEEATDILVAVEFFYMGEENDIRLGFDNDVKSSIHGTWLFMNSEYTWAYGGWFNSSNLCLNIYTSIPEFVCPGILQSVIITPSQPCNRVVFQL